MACGYTYLPWPVERLEMETGISAGPIPLVAKEVAGVDLHEWALLADHETPFRGTELSVILS